MVAAGLDGADFGMNWRRGLVRVWVVFSAVWVLASGGYELSRWVVYSNEARRTYPECVVATPPSPWCSDWTQFPPYDPFSQFIDGLPRRPDIFIGVGLIVLPPIMLLVCGAALGWVGSGFRRNSN